MSLVYNATFDKNTRKLSFEDKAGNEIYSFTVPERAPAVDDITKPLTFKATQDGSTVKLTKRGSPVGDFQTSRDGGNTWEDYTIDTVITLNIGDKVSFRAKADRSAQILRNYFQFKMTGKIEAWHNVMSLYRTNDFATYDTVVDYAFQWLFENCTSLTKAPVLPATTLADSCYWSMFSGCGSLTKAPVLPATTLAVDCYYQMFSGCRSLVKAPELTATTLANRCFNLMFSGCQNLNEVHCQMPSSYSASDIESKYASSWLGGVSSTGTFYTNPDANWSSGASGIPTGWRRVNEEAPAVDDPNKPLMLRAIEDNSSVTLTNRGTLSNTYQTSTNGTDWTNYTLGTEISLNKGESVYFRCSKHQSEQSSTFYVHFSMTGKIEAWHNAYSMISSDFSSAEESVGDYGMNGLFEYCSSLTKAPLLLNALSPYCYIGTFLGTSITQAPVLPATALAEGCYMSIFSSCYSLTQAPVLPATTLAKKCYSCMFSNCDSLTQAPALPSTTLAEGCYKDMFWKCPKLKEVRISATKTATNALQNWLSEVAATGDFYCDPNAAIFPRNSESGIPSGWRRLNINNYPSAP